MTITRSEAGIRCPREGARAWLLDITGPWGKVVVDLCPECESIWFDGGELESTLDARGLWEKMLRGMWFESGFACPRCGVKMVVTLADSVVEELCRHCRGVWIVRKDLESLTRVLADRIQSVALLEPETRHLLSRDQVRLIKSRLVGLAGRGRALPARPRKSRSRSRSTASIR
ncbi:MAG TPA: zf-TFIIB domain-containing protein [Thermoplasmata archaeon]|nr:zf-TFIIB domain-containing protein [Thermoplasmata archaeon]